MTLMLDATHSTETGPTKLFRFLDQAPDSAGRRRFVLFWIGRDDLRLGTLAAQNYYADPAGLLDNAQELVMLPGENDTAAACRVLGCKRTERRAVAS